MLPLIIDSYHRFQSADRLIKIENFSFGNWHMLFNMSNGVGLVYWWLAWWTRNFTSSCTMAAGKTLDWTQLFSYNDRVGQLELIYPSSWSENQWRPVAGTTRGCTKQHVQHALIMSFSAMIWQLCSSAVKILILWGVDPLVPKMSLFTTRRI